MVEEDDELFSFFDELSPPSPPPAVPTEFVHYTSPVSSLSLNLRLSTQHPLWGHVLYPASVQMGRFLEKHSETLVKGKNVLELGAGAGLPGLISVLMGAEKVVTTDFPDPSLIDNLRFNADTNLSQEGGMRGKLVVEGFTWGSNPKNLFESLSPDSTSRKRKFDLVLMSDLVFNHSQHEALLRSCEAALEGISADRDEAQFSTPCALCFYSHHRPKAELVEKDLGFLEMARTRGWKVVRVLEEKEAGPAFAEDGGDLAVRSTVHGFLLSFRTK